MTAPDHTTRAVELLTSIPRMSEKSAEVRVAAAQVEATLALADALMDRRDYDTYRRSSLAEVVARRTSHTSHPTSSTSHMAEQWHAISDHAADGTPFGGPLCNCERVASRARELGWAPVDRPRWDDDLRAIGERDRLREGIRRLANDPRSASTRGYLLALLADDETHRNPITVAGTPAEQRHREEKP